MIWGDGVWGLFVFLEQSRLSLEDQNEVSLLTALTEILDNADSENLSPFDSIPDSELLVSPREGSSSVSVGPGEGAVWLLQRLEPYLWAYSHTSETQAHLRSFSSP